MKVWSLSVCVLLLLVLTGGCRQPEPRRAAPTAPPAPPGGNRYSKCGPETETCDLSSDVMIPAPPALGRCPWRPVPAVLVPLPAESSTEGRAVAVRRPAVGSPAASTAGCPALKRLGCG